MAREQSSLHQTGVGNHYACSTTMAIINRIPSSLRLLSVCVLGEQTTHSPKRHPTVGTMKHEGGRDRERHTHFLLHTDRYMGMTVECVCALHSELCAGNFRHPTQEIRHHFQSCATYRKSRVYGMPRLQYFYWLSILLLSLAQRPGM